jgi:hypothetical protein
MALPPWPGYNRSLKPLTFFAVLPAGLSTPVGAQGGRPGAASVAARSASGRGSWFRGRVELLIEPADDDRFVSSAASRRAITNLSSPERPIDNLTRPLLPLTLSGSYALRLISLTSMLPCRTSTKGWPRRMPTVPYPVAVDRNARKSPLIDG